MQGESRISLSARPKRRLRIAVVAQTVEDEVARIEKDLATLKKTDVQLTEQRKAAYTKLKKLEKSMTEDRHGKSEAENAMRNHGETLERFGGEKEKLKGELEKEQAELGKVMDNLRGTFASILHIRVYELSVNVNLDVQTRSKDSRLKSKLNNKLSHLGRNRSRRNRTRSRSLSNNSTISRVEERVSKPISRELRRNWRS